MKRFFEKVALDGARTYPSCNMQGKQFVFDLKKLHQNEKTEEKAADTTPTRDTKKSDDAATSPQSAQLRDESPASAQAKKVVAATEMVREFAVIRDTEKGLAREGSRRNHELLRRFLAVHFALAVAVA